MSLYGRGDEKVQSKQDRERQQSRDRIEDANQSTRPGDVNLADLKGQRRG